jgi:hypothetical protein
VHFGAVPRLKFVARLHWLFIGLILVLSSSRAEAATMGILRPESNAAEIRATLFRLKGELLAVGLDVELVERPTSADLGTSDRRAALEKTAAEREIAALIDVVGDTVPVAVEIWIFKRTLRHSEVSRVLVETNRENGPETLPIRAIEVLRSRLVELDWAAKQRPPRAPLVPAGATVRTEKQGVERVELVERFGLAAGLAVVTSLDGVGPAVLPLLRLDWAPHSKLSVQATLAGFGSRPQVTGAAGSVRVAQEYAVLGVCYCQSTPPGLRPFAALAAGVMRTALSGEATPPAKGHSVELLSFVLESSLGVRWRSSGPFFLALASQLQLAQPYVSIHFADTVVGSTGRPNLLFSLTAGAWL